MHLVIAYAAPADEPGRAALAGLGLPRLHGLIAAATALARDQGDGSSLSPPHERALAGAFGWSGGDGRLPFAAWQAQADGIDTGDLAWGLATPVHWHVGAEQVSAADPDALQLDEAASRALLDAVRELYTSEGFQLLYGAPTRWYLAHHSLAQLASASLDRVVGRSVAHWLDAGREARLLRRLQNETQMVWHGHPVNDAREARGALAVNSLWLSGCGPAQRCSGTAELELRLRGPALAGDWPAWAQAWQAIDAGLPARGLTRLTLCGERGAASFALQRTGWLQRAGALFRRNHVAGLLEGL